MTLANCLAGGIMLTLGIVYVLREAIEIFEEECGQQGCVLPWAYIIVVISYAANVWLEHFFQLQYHKRMERLRAVRQNSVDW